MDGPDDRLVRLWFAHCWRAVDDLIAVERATGVLMERRGCEPTQARAILLREANAAHLALEDMARVVVARRW
ncbi:ANTAR domain-containing protein [Amycolatopsis sp. WQ 127309]|uniref:ANTAR domain-containing protein n=1 Tax=Amycolatopsis sp. WQ 127309 TaxID=2932773 RepID=UPI003530435A